MTDIAEALGIPAGPRGFHCDDPYPLEVPIRVRGLVGGGNLGADCACEPFLEDTLTVLVSPRGAVLRLAAHAAPGQMIMLSSPRLGHEMLARVVRYRSNADVKGYAEIEFAPDAAVPALAVCVAPTATESPAPRTSSQSRSAPLVIAPLPDRLDERPHPRRNYEPLNPAVAPQRSVEAKPKRPAKQLPHVKAIAEVDIESLLAARKAAAQAAVEAKTWAQKIAQRLLEPSELTVFAAPRRPRKRWLAVAAALLLTLGAAGTWAVVANGPALEPLPEIAAFALPGPPIEFVMRNEVRGISGLLLETESLPLATRLIPPALTAAGLQPRAVVVKQRGMAESYAAPEVSDADGAPSAEAKPGAPAALAPLGTSTAATPPVSKPLTEPQPPVGGAVVPPRLVSQAPVVYPQMARMTRAEGNVVIDARVDESGRVVEMRIVSGPALFHQAAKDSLAQWRYQPALLNGKPIATHLYVTIQFRR